LAAKRTPGCASLPAAHRGVIGTDAPDFHAETTEGPIRFHEWLGDSWGVLFSHPKDFTPVCTTELGYDGEDQAGLRRRNVKIIGLSVDPVESHQRWSQDIAETQGTAPNYPMIGDVDLTVSKLYGMLPAEAERVLQVDARHPVGPPPAERGPDLPLAAAQLIADQRPDVRLRRCAGRR
jgi:alkyl hydroperoxide reductase subunit AhpC